MLQTRHAITSLEIWIFEAQTSYEQIKITPSIAVKWLLNMHDHIWVYEVLKRACLGYFCLPLVMPQHM